ncbi:MAG: extracellular solute-binding protein [Pseudomonadota bacterium]
MTSLLDDTIRRILLAFVGSCLAIGLSHADPQHGIAMHGDPGYAPDFTHFSYVNPDAPIGGDLTVATLGRFDSLNPFIVRGSPVIQLRSTNYVFERLMGRAFDEPFSLYGLLAETIEVPEDRAWVEFTLRPEARFSDGTPVKVDDVIFSFERLRDDGRPNYRNSYSKVATVDRIGERGVRFTFNDTSDRELPLIIGLLQVLPKHVYDGERFNEAGLDTPIGSGPYLVDEVEAGSQIRFRRNPDYWGWDVPVVRGQYNFETMTVDYYRDNGTMFEAFRKGLVDYRNEADPTRWATAYEFPAVEDGRVVTETIETSLPKGMDGMVFNTRREIFADVRVRKALTLLFDFEWINKTLYYGLFGRTESYFHGSPLSSLGVPMDARETEILAPFGRTLDPSLMDGSFALPKSNGSGRDRRALRAALTLFEEAGYELREGVLTNTTTGEPFTFEYMVVSRDQERLGLSYAKSLERAGIEMVVRQIDSTQFQQRRQTYDYDMFQNRWFLSLSPGNEQKFYWGSPAADAEGTRNYMGVKNPAIDAAIEALLAARSREDLESAARLLDRLLLDGYYVIPLFHTPAQWIGRWAGYKRPETGTLYGSPVETWWHAPTEQ